MTPPLLLAAGDPLSHVLPHKLHKEPLFQVKLGGENLDIPMFGIHDGVYSFYFTNHALMTLVVALVVLLTFMFVAKRVKASGTGVEAYETKGRLAQFFETICVFIREEVARPNLGHLTDKYIPYIWSVFFLILFANVLGLVPFGYALQVITGNNPGLSYFQGTATSNLALNAMLALCSFIAVLFIGIREAGLKHFLNHFNPVGWSLAMLPIGIMLFILEWMGLIIKCVVLAMRLFGTMMAGHLVIAAFVGLIFVAGEVGAGLGYGVGIAVVLGGTALMLLELFIALLQAFIFTFLTVLFIATTAVTHHEEEEGHHQPEPEEDPYVEPEVRNAALG